MRRLGRGSISCAVWPNHALSYHNIGVALAHKERLAEADANLEESKGTQLVVSTHGHERNESRIRTGRRGGKVTCIIDENNRRTAGRQSHGQIWTYSYDSVELTSLVQEGKRNEKRVTLGKKRKLATLVQKKFVPKRNQ